MSDQIVIRNGIKLEFARFQLPEFSKMSLEQARAEFARLVLNGLHDLEIVYSVGQGVEFTPEWFDKAGRIAENLLGAKGIRHSRTGKLLKLEALDAQRRIAAAIIDRVNEAKLAIASNDKLSLYRCGVGIIHLFARMAWEPDRVRGQKIALAVTQGGTIKGLSNANQREDWKLRADAIRRKNPNLSDAPSRGLSIKSGKKLSARRLGETRDQRNETEWQTVKSKNSQPQRGQRASGSRSAALSEHERR